MKITICGSIAFYPAMELARDELSARGHEVKVPALSLEAPQEYGGDTKIAFDQYINQQGGIDAFPAGHAIWDLKAGAIREHFTKIDWCDAILVINEEKRDISGYVGGNTLIEMGLAFYLKKGIYLLNEVSSELSYKQEIMGMAPQILKRDVRLIAV